MLRPKLNAWARNLGISLTIYYSLLYKCYLNYNSGDK